MELRHLESPPCDYRPFPDVPQRNRFQESLEVPALVRTLGLAATHVLEIGCGRGVALPPLARLLRPDRLVGIDIEPGALAHAHARARARGVTVELYRADVRALPFPDASFELVIDFGTCYHIGDPDQALREIVRVLRPGGLFVSETVSSQLLSHPFRTRGRRLPWAAAPELRVERQALLWKSRRRSPHHAANTPP
jgi:ubiquinone/menaquinone biosynthesis C-methylase UbiE